VRGYAVDCYHSSRCHQIDVPADPDDSGSLTV